MPNPVKFIDILSRNTAIESVFCDDCEGSGEILNDAPDTGAEPIECGQCLGTGYNQLGLILQGILKPPPEGYGPVELKEAISTHLEEVKRRQMIHEAQVAISEAQQAITETQEMIAKAQELIAVGNSDIRRSLLNPAGQRERPRRIS